MGELEPGVLSVGHSTRMADCKFSRKVDSRKSTDERYPRSEEKSHLAFLLCKVAQLLYSAVTSSEAEGSRGGIQTSEISRNRHKEEPKLMSSSWML